MEKNDGNDGFSKLEFWALTAVFVYWMLELTAVAESVEPGLPIRYTLIFLAFLYVNFKVIPGIIERNAIIKRSLILVGIWMLIVLVYVMTDRLFYGPDVDPVEHDTLLPGSMIQSAVFALAVAGYVVVKRAALYLISKADAIQRFFVIFNRDSIIIFALYMTMTYWLAILAVPTELWNTWLIFIPTGIILHGVAFNMFIPPSLRWKYPLVSYFFKMAITCWGLGFLGGIIMLFVTQSEQRGFQAGFFTGVFHFVITAPALWLIYRWQMKGKEQIFALQSQLGRSAADLNFLRSQINPHFLFNALNTIYGLAIQEQAQRTSSAVEKLGDMMRFMLNENTQDRISLSREIEYLNNYIELQKLRTDSNPALRIQIDIPENVDPLIKITPMLLIPFIENAFKHGISMVEESYIKVSLELKEKTLYFDVHNSRHQKNGSDPEKNSNGIGLDNVRLRLLHLYPRKHELMVRETNRDFFVHLRLDLN